MQQTKTGKQLLHEKRMEMMLSVLKEFPGFCLDDVRYSALREFYGLTRTQVDSVLGDLLANGQVTAEHAGACLVFNLTEGI